jgi:hypothetical protein
MGCWAGETHKPHPAQNISLCDFEGLGKALPQQVVGQFKVLPVVVTQNAVFRELQRRLTSSMGG